jgi:hypothetical protein
MSEIMSEIVPALDMELQDTRKYLVRMVTRMVREALKEPAETQTRSTKGG